MAFGVRDARLTCSGKLKIPRLRAAPLRLGAQRWAGRSRLRLVSAQSAPTALPGLAQSAFLPVFPIDTESLGAAAGSRVGHGSA